MLVIFKVLFLLWMSFNCPKTKKNAWRKQGISINIVWFSSVVKAFVFFILYVKHLFLYDLQYFLNVNVYILYFTWRLLFHARLSWYSEMKNQRHVYLLKSYQSRSKCIRELVSDKEWTDAEKRGIIFVSTVQHSIRWDKRRHQRDTGFISLINNHKNVFDSTIGLMLILKTAF